MKTSKRLLTYNASPNGSLDNDGLALALLAYHKTPEPGCKLSPVKIMLGPPVKRDSMSYISKDVMIFNNSELHGQWKEA